MLSYSLSIFICTKQKHLISPLSTAFRRKSVEEHLGLYAGYVKNFNAISALMPEYAKDSEKNAHALAELIRRRSFEFGGMRLHEYYFSQFEGGAKPLVEGSPLQQQLAKEYMKAEHIEPYIKAIGNMRGPGWLSSTGIRRQNSSSQASPASNIKDIL